MKILSFNISILNPKIARAPYQFSHIPTFHIYIYISKSIFFPYQFAFNFFYQILLKYIFYLSPLIMSTLPNHQYQGTITPQKSKSSPIINQDIFILRIIYFIPISNQDLSSNHWYISKPLSFSNNVSFRFFVTLLFHSKLFSLLKLISHHSYCPLQGYNK